MQTEDPDDKNFSPSSTAVDTATFAGKYSYILINQTSVTSGSQRYMSTIEDVTMDISLGAV